MANAIEKTPRKEFEADWQSGFAPDRQKIDIRIVIPSPLFGDFGSLVRLDVESLTEPE